MRSTGANTCDTCGEFLHGRKGIAFVKKDYIAIRGAMTVQLPSQQDYVWITKDPETELHFCNTECLAEYVNFRVDTVMKHKKEREEAILRAEGTGYGGR